MTIVYPEYVSGRLGRYGYFERDVTTALLDLLKPGMTFFDVGAHFGYFSLLASALVGPSGSVHCFEPTPPTFEVLQKNATRKPNIQCHNLALYSEPGTLQFWVHELHGSAFNFVVSPACRLDKAQIGCGRVRRVSAVTLDQFSAEHGDPDVIKLDVEGVEGPVLNGMRDLIHRRHPLIIMEVGDKVNAKTENGQCRDNVERLLGAGYEAFDYRTGQPRHHAIEAFYAPGNLVFRHPDS